MRFLTAPHVAVSFHIKLNAFTYESFFLASRINHLRFSSMFSRVGIHWVPTWSSVRMWIFSSSNPLSCKNPFIMAVSFTHPIRQMEHVQLVSVCLHLRPEKYNTVWFQRQAQLLDAKTCSVDCNIILTSLLPLSFLSPILRLSPHCIAN